MNTIQDIDLDGKFVHELIVVHGPIGAIEIIRKCFTEKMNPNVKDETLRIMLWQITHSLDALRDRTGRLYHNVSDIETLAKSTDDKDTHTSARHIIGALDKLTLHVA